MFSTELSMKKDLLPRDLMGLYHSDIAVMWLSVSCARGSSSWCHELVCGMLFFLVILTFLLFQEKMKANMVVHLLSKSII